MQHVDIAHDPATQGEHDCFIRIEVLRFANLGTGRGVSRAGGPSGAREIGLVRSARQDSAGPVGPCAASTSTPHGRLGWHMRIGSGAADATLLFSIGDIGTPAHWPMDASVSATAVAVDLPGHGASSAWRVDGLTMAAIADGILDTLHQHPALAGRAVELRACGGAVALAVALAARLGTRCRSLRLHDPLPLDADETARFLATLPTLQVQAGGEHLLPAWNWARERRLYWLWRPADAACAVLTAAPPPLQVHADVQQMLQWWRAVAVLHRLRAPAI